MKKPLPDARLKEGDVAPQIRQGLQSTGAHVFRNNVGAAKLKGFWVRFGVGGKGGSDHIGYLPVKVTQEMVGHYVAVFMAVESKRPVGGTISDDQMAFMTSVRAAGGIAGVVRGWQEARDLVDRFFRRFTKPIDHGIKNP